MPNPPFPNVYTHRKVADTSSKPCDICYKTSTSVLVVPDNKVRKEDAHLIIAGLWSDISRTSSSSAPAI